ncbi:hypothetical protein N7519_003656 [Penicillium mononematosum]|uniref:uncharacterized protein n=1 Tax=Penicillium mononematosum TaxID=268346 RepID=UPI002547C0ED|nr:uncharacterized protein N7519_003656 [Penicillium mononematosum]KAJ6188748.1 hypothetical protein N7519_003656 [Penicillium mononematosum]
MHDLANGLWDTEVSVVISWMQPGTDGGRFTNFGDVFWDMTVVAIQGLDGGNMWNSSSGH